MLCNKCHRPMKGTTAYDGACECGGLIEAVPRYTLQVVWECGSRQTLLAGRYNALRAFLRTRPTWRHAVITRGTHTILVVV